jgi:hypothetical protein
MAKRSETNAEEFAKEVNQECISYEDEVRQNIKDAAREMVLRAKETTPPMGAPRGTNAVTGALADHWESYIEELENGDTAVHLMNNMQYASFVNDGHTMKKHFVPWLYIDSSGLISRYTPISGEQLFGLVVGTKTKYVPPANMVEQAQERFAEVLEILMAQTNAKFGVSEH